MASFDVRILPYQNEVLQCQEKEILFSAGIGTGKTFIGAHWVINKIFKNPQGCKILIAANTYSQLIGATVQTLVQVLEEFKIPHTKVLSGSKKRIIIAKTEIYLFSLENPDTIRGIEVSYAWLDEVAFSTLDALNVVRGRLRGKKTLERQLLLTSSPNGFNFLYDEFVNKKDKNKRLIKAKTNENKFLPFGYYDSLLEMYGGENSPLAKQELFGEFVSLQSGAIYNLFNRNLNVKNLNLNQAYPVYVGVDFNIDKMSATYLQYIEGVFYVCKEVQLTNNNANTFDLGQEILKDLKGYNVYIVPDSTGKARKSSATAGKTDVQILRDLGLTVMDTYNPLIRDRQNNLNIKFLKHHLFIDDNCTKTIKEIETLSARENEGTVAHLSVTVGYVCWKLDPLKAKSKPSFTVQL